MESTGRMTNYIAKILNLMKTIYWMCNEMTDCLSINSNSLRTNTRIGCDIYLLVKTNNAVDQDIFKRFIGSNKGVYIWVVTS